MPRKKTETFDFEQSLHKLNQLVETMERGDLALETALKNFEEGIGLIRECQTALANAEQKVKILTKENGMETLQSFQADTANDN